MLIEKRITDLLDAFASSDPTPGGGSAAALSGAMGAALLAMVAGLPKTRTGAAEERTALDAARQDLVDLRKRLAELVDRDTEAYDLVVAAFKKPKATDAEKADRQRAIQDAMRVATEVPAETVAVVERALQAARAVAQHGNPAAKSDAAVGMHLLITAMQGALFNVSANIGSLKDPGTAERITKSVNESLQSAGVAIRDIFGSPNLSELTAETEQRFRLPGHGGSPGRP